MAITRKRPALLLSWLSGLAALTSACGYAVNGNAPASTPDVVAPSILQQPADQSVPMGLPATYSVTAAGTPLQYQWTRNGVDVPNASGSTYVTPATTFADDASTYSVVVSNSAGTVTSVAVTLKVTARAPLAGDLRFQQVDALSTVNGYGAAGAATGTLSGANAKGFDLNLGTALMVGRTDTCSSTNTTAEATCSWAFTTIPLSDSLSALDLVAGYASDVTSNLDYDLGDPNWPNLGPGVSPATSDSVVTSLDLEPKSQLFAVSWMQVPANQQTSFTPEHHSVAPVDLPAAALQEGQHSRVITAISYAGGEINYLAYGWSGDPATVYDTQVSTASAAAAPAAAAALAAQGYLITATGSADDSGDVVFVGTRVAGDSMARPFMTAQAADVQAMMQQGYATVGVVAGGAGSSPVYLGER